MKIFTFRQCPKISFEIYSCCPRRIPKPTSALLDETPRHEVVDEILEDFRMTFSSLEETLAWRLDAKLVFLKEKRDHSRKRAGPKRE